MTNGSIAAARCLFCFGPVTLLPPGRTPSQNLRKEFRAPALFNLFDFQETVQLADAGGMTHFA